MEAPGAQELEEFGYELVIKGERDDQRLKLKWRRKQKVDGSII